MIYVDELKKVKWYRLKFATFTNFSICTSLIYLSRFQILKSLVKYILIRFILDYTLVRMNTTNETEKQIPHILFSAEISSISSFASIYPFIVDIYWFR